MSDQDRACRQVISLIKAASPEAEIVLAGETYEDEDVLLFVYVSDEAVKKMQNYLRKVTLDILLEQDVDIVTLVQRKQHLKDTYLREA